jgi:hypothetical protein
MRGPGLAESSCRHSRTVAALGWYVALLICGRLLSRGAVVLRVCPRLLLYTCTRANVLLTAEHQPHQRFKVYRAPTWERRRGRHGVRR